ncbi:MAG TPA: glycosyltransferase family protein, partial [Myxococcaceae bacterium]|nr:glycosyltransferase family protein [Myxococcaceae bacterium]
MRILYGVVGEGMGHATRSRVILEHLARAHDVHVVVSGRARDYLARHFANVHRIWGLTIQYGDNRVRSWRTL